MQRAGNVTITPLSTTSIVRIESVSEASAIGDHGAERQAGAQHRAREGVAEDEGQHDAEHDRREVREPRAVPIAIPATSPIAQPVRQWRVAATAVAVRARPPDGIS